MLSVGFLISPDAHTAGLRTNNTAASTFCKCTCFTNSTIIPLGPQKHADRSLAARASSSSCSQCNRAFCLDYNLPICKNAEEKDVITMCFQRDSRKDQIIVWFFILGTGGLLGWTAVQKILAVRAARAAAREPLLSHSRGQGQGLVQRAASSIGLGGSSGRSPLASPGPADTGPRGQYAPLGGSGD